MERRGIGDGGRDLETVGNSTVPMHAITHSLPPTTTSNFCQQCRKFLCRRCPYLHSLASANHQVLRQWQSLTTSKVWCPLLVCSCHPTLPQRTVRLGPRKDKGKGRRKERKGLDAKIGQGGTLDPLADGVLGERAFH